MSLSGPSWTFPRGLAGTGLLLLRFTIGAAVIIQGGRYFDACGMPFDAVCLPALASLMLGLALLLGILTRTAAILAAAGAIGIQCCAPPSILLAATSLSLAFIGPGAFSIDARLFGFRRVVIARPAGQRKPVKIQRRDGDAGNH
ncbi:hypothetical protein [Pseudoduganella rhizocola]|uniref:hypothetical protein n=1 Tax=Pseudoduganella rhizocola TaxID=3382643 RepID=UPI0038B4A2AF